MLPIERLADRSASAASPPADSSATSRFEPGDAADTAALNEIDGVAELTPAALLHAALEDPVAGADGVREGFAFFDGVGDGLFEVDVFAGARASQATVHVPVVGGGDEDGVDLLVVEHLAIIQMRGGRPVEAVRSFTSSRRGPYTSLTATIS